MGERIQGGDKAIHRFAIIPSGTEGYAKAEGTVGTVDTARISSKTMEAATYRGEDLAAQFWINRNIMFIAILSCVFFMSDPM